LSSLLLLVIAVLSPAFSPAAPLVEPNAGKWKTWVLTSGSDFRLPPPPGASDTQAEIRDLLPLTSQLSDATLDRIRFWDAGPPSYRWVDLAIAQISQKPFSNQKNARAMALLNVAIYDATIAAWDSKYSYNRQRPSVTNNLIATAVGVPASPSYPSEHAVVASAAAAILSYLYPTNAQTFVDAAREASYTRVLAGVQYPSDVTAGYALGKVVADRVIAQARTDGSDAVWTGTVPTGPGLWNGTNPIEPLAGTWKPWVLISGDQLRPGPPPAFDSAQEATELAEIKSFPRTFGSNSKAFYWQTFDGILADWYNIAGKRIFEHHLDENQPRVARIYALMSVAHYDASIACWDAKFTYWAIRPFQLDPTVVTIFTTPNHPSYPAAHGTQSGAISEVMAYAFPQEAASIRAKGTEAGMSRIWAGIHFRSDVEVGLALGRAVAQLVIQRVQNDGSQ
ncbi:MAG: phosphatase PAP2 family protein, partial [Acidobacteriota bacterium]